jgi:pimeloyl-ACP methyl ester carboxylesterase
VSTAPWIGNPVGELRWQAELARLVVDPVFRGAGLPRGDGRVVIVVPGFGSGDGSTAILRDWLRRLDYVPEPAGMPFNVDCSARALEALERRAARHERPVTLLGHSRGGLLSRALATVRPDLVRRVVVLGSGLEDGYDISVALRLAVLPFRGFQALTSDRVTRRGCMTRGCRCPFGAASRAPFPEDIDLVSIFTREDGLAHPRASRVAYATNIELTGSHTGLVVNRKAYRAIAYALAGRAAELRP